MTISGMGGQNVRYLEEILPIMSVNLEQLDFDNLKPRNDLMLLTSPMRSSGQTFCTIFIRYVSRRRHDAQEREISV
jgi:hypothetical protein